MKREFRGGWRPGAHRPRAPKPFLFLDGVPEMPEWVTKDSRARALWTTLVPKLAAAGLVSAVDSAMIQVYVGARVRQQDAEREVRSIGLWIRDPRTGKSRPGPAARIARNSAQTTEMVGQSLGLSLEKPHTDVGYHF